MANPLFNFSVPFNLRKPVCHDVKQRNMMANITTDKVKTIDNYDAVDSATLTDSDLALIRHLTSSTYSNKKSTLADLRTFLLASHISDFNTLSSKVSGIDTAYKAADTNIDTAYKSADADIITAYKNADSDLTTRINNISSELNGTSTATALTYLLRDGNARAKMAAPAATDDIAILATACQFGECSTNAQAYEVTISNFILTTGTRIAVKFDNACGFDSPTLNVSSTGAKPLTMNGTSVNYGCWDAGQICTLIYDGTNWEFVGWDVRGKSFGDSSGYIKYRNGKIEQRNKQTMSSPAIDFRAVLSFGIGFSDVYYAAN